MKRKIETWQNKHTSKVWCWWGYNSHMENEGILFHPRGIAYLWLSEKCDYFSVKFIQNNIIHSLKSDGKITRIGAVRQANKFIKEITGGKK